MNQQKLHNLLSEYNNKQIQHIDYHLRDCAMAENLEDAIEIAATALNCGNKKHSHQFRIPNDVLREFADTLLYKTKSILLAESFEELLEIVRSCRVKGIGELTIYDAAQRIGNYLKIYPSQVYLHNGTRTGAEIVLGKIKAKSLSLSQFPEPFQNAGLTPAELEDFLCICKRQLKVLYQGETEQAEPISQGCFRNAETSKGIDLC